MAFCGLDLRARVGSSCAFADTARRVPGTMNPELQEIPIDPSCQQTKVPRNNQKELVGP